MDEDVHISACVVCLGQCGWVQWFGILTAVWYKLPYVWQWSSKTSWQCLRCNAATHQWRHSSMTSIFIDAQLRRSADHINGQFWRFLGNLNPKMLLAIVWTPKRHFLTPHRVFWAIAREIPWTGYFSRRVRKKYDMWYVRPNSWHITGGRSSTSVNGDIAIQWEWSNFDHS